MTYKEESYVLDTLKEIQETIRSPEFKQLVKETHENNMMEQVMQYKQKAVTSMAVFNQDKISL